MEFRIGELCRKEVIDVMDGSRYGYVGDAEIDLETGQVRALVVPGRLRLLGLLGREEDHIFPWAAIKRLGEDIILVEGIQTGRRSGRKNH
jgi:sporulation protein, YlmC/YmxH family